MVVTIIGSFRRRRDHDDIVLLMFAATLSLSKMEIRIRRCRRSSRRRTNHPIVKHVMYYRWYDLVEYIRGGGNDFTAHLMQWCYNYFGEKRVNDDDKWW